jgi:tol-pal system protein YbgF
MMHMAGRGKIRRGRRLGIVLVVVLAGSGCASFPGDLERVDREMVRLRQELAGVVKSNEAARQMYEQRLARLEGGPRAPDAPGSAQIDLSQRLHELLDEYRALQGKLEEHTDALERLQRRVDALESPAPAPRGRTPAAAPRSSTKPPAAPPQPAPSALTPEEVYQKALAGYMRGDYDVAISGFRGFIGSYPRAPQAANAQYWLGEAYFSQRNYAQAVDEFAIVVRDYPDSPKAPSALFKQGDAYARLNDARQAASVLCELITRYPRSREALLARERQAHCQPSAPAARRLAPTTVVDRS